MTSVSTSWVNTVKLIILGYAVTVAARCLGCCHVGRLDAFGGTAGRMRASARKGAGGGKAAEVMLKAEVNG